MITKKALAHIKSLEKQIPIWAEDAILEKRGEIVNLVKFGQLAKGFNSYGEQMQLGVGYKGYSPSTQGFADRDGISIPKTEGAPYNFQWSGQTFDNMKLEDVDEKKFTYSITTVKSKQDLLERIYGEIFDLTDEHNNWVNENIIEPYLAKKIQEQLFNF